MFIDASTGSASTLRTFDRAQSRAKVEWVDTHSHLNINAFELDRDEVIKRCFKNNVWLINVGTNYETSKKAVEIAEKYEKGVYAAIGLHPINIKQNQKSKIPIRPSLRALGKNQNDKSKFKNIENILEEEFSYEGYKELTKSKKVVAVGEIGLDYYWKPKTTKKKELFKQKQKELLLKELKLAEELNLPVIFHCRMAFDDLIDILQGSDPCKLNGVIHCFTGNWKMAKKFLNLGFYLGFNGIIFKLDLDEIIKKTPLDRILIETDCPYLTPPNLGKERNDPLGVKFVAERIAEIKNVGFDKIAEITTENAKRLFKLG